VLELIGIVFLFAVIWVGLHALALVLIGGLDWDDVRSILLHYAYKSFTREGDVIPGVRPFAGTRLVIRILSPKDEARSALVARAMAATERRKPALGGFARLWARVFQAPEFAPGQPARARSPRFATPVVGAVIRGTRTSGDPW
jgi:hypothetical protein